MSNPKAPSITFPPLTDCDGNHEPVLSVRFAVGKFTIDITTDGAGAYLDMEIDGHAEMNASELTALASWAESACKAMDKHNGEGEEKNEHDGCRILPPASRMQRRAQMGH